MAIRLLMRVEQFDARKDHMFLCNMEYVGQGVADAGHRVEVREAKQGDAP